MKTFILFSLIIFSLSSCSFGGEGTSLKVSLNDVNTYWVQREVVFLKTNEAYLEFDEKTRLYFEVPEKVKLITNCEVFSFTLVQGLPKTMSNFLKFCQEPERVKLSFVTPIYFINFETNFVYSITDSDTGETFLYSKAEIMEILKQISLLEVVRKKMEKYYE